MTSVTGNDAAWIDSAERSARALRAAAVTALTNGISVEDAIRIFQDGVREANRYAMTASSQRTLAQIAAITGYVPSGELLPTPGMENGRSDHAAPVYRHAA